MRRNELTFDAIEVLKEAVAKFQPDLLQAVRKKLTGRELKLLDYVFSTYYQQGKSLGRWYDPYHILLSTHFAVQLEMTNDLISPLIIPGIILHDIGYTALPPEGAKENWSALKYRPLHMELGRAIAAESLVKAGDYDTFETGVIADEMVATHDNWILGIPISDPDTRALIDADRVLIMSFISFYKDWVSEAGHPADFSLQDLYELRHDSFYCKNAPYTSLAKHWREKQFGARFAEIQENIAKDKEVFLQCAEESLKAELDSFKGQVAQ